MTGSAGTAFVDLEPRFGGGWSSSIVREAQTAGTAGSRVLGGFVGKTSGLFRGLDSQLAAFGVPFAGQLTTISSHLDGVTRAEHGAASGAARFKDLGTAAYLGVAAAAAAIGVASAKVFLAGEQDRVQLEQVLKNTGHSWDEYGGHIEKVVEQGAALGFNQEEVEVGLTKLIRATKDPTKALDQLGLAEDVARAKGVDLASASQLIANADAGRLRGLVPLGVALKDSTGKTLTQAEALQRLAEITKGDAAESAHTYAGEIRTLGAEAHNLEERIGSGVVPVVAELGKGLLAGVHAIQAINGVTGGWLGNLAQAAFVGGAVLITVNKLSSGLASLGGWLKTSTGYTQAHAAAEADDAAATTTAASAHVVAAEGAATEAAADQTLANSQLRLFTTTEEVAAAEGQLAFLFPEVATGASATAIAMDELAVSETAVGGAAVFLKGHLASLGVGGAITSVITGFLLGKQAGDAINKRLGGMKPNVDELTKSFEDLANAHRIDGVAATEYGDHLQQLAGDIKTSQGSTIEKAFGFAPSAHKAVKDIDAANEALDRLLEQKGFKVANSAWMQLREQLVADGVAVDTVNQKFDPFLAKMALAATHMAATTDASHELGQSFNDLATKQLAGQSAQLSIADSFDQVRQAEDALKDARADEAGTGPKAIAAAEQEASARQSLASAIDSQEQATISLGDAREKLAQFDSPTDTRVRTLERTQIVDRIVTTPEEARQKEIDLLQFDESNANKRADLQKQIESAEHSVAQATDGVARAQEGVSKAADARKQVQTDAANTVREGERKLKEATIAVALELQKAADAGTINNTQLQAYLTLLSEISLTTDPNGVLAKNLKGIVEQMSLAALLKASLGPAAPQGPQGPITKGTVFPPIGPAHQGESIAPVGPGGPSGAAASSGPSGAGVHIDARQTVHVQGGVDTQSLHELDTANRKQAIRLANAGVRG